MAVQPTKIQDPSKVARRLLPYLAPFKAKLALIGVLLIVGTLAELAGPYLIGVAVDQFIDPAEGIQRAAWLTALLGDGVSRLQGLNVVMGLLAITFLLSWALQVFQFNRRHAHRQYRTHLQHPNATLLVTAHFGVHITLNGFGRLFELAQGKQQRVRQAIAHRSSQQLHRRRPDAIP